MVKPAAAESCREMIMMRNTRYRHSNLLLFFDAAYNPINDTNPVSTPATIPPEDISCVNTDAQEPSRNCEFTNAEAPTKISANSSRRILYSTNREAVRLLFGVEDDVPSVLETCIF
jgi:hypothetical protein